MRTLVVLAALVLTLGYANASTVIVMRHCVRSTDNNTWDADSSYIYSNNYTAQPWPQWPNNTAPYLCLPNGKLIVQGEGAWLKANANLPQPIHVTCDNVTRDQTTSEYLVKGLGQAIDVVVDHAPFGSACPKISHHNADYYVTENLDRHPAPANYDSLVSQLAAITGKGVAPTIPDIPNVVAHGKFEGGIMAAEDQAERLLMELGGDMPVIGWGKTNTEQIYELVALHLWQRQVSRAVPQIQANLAASIVSHLMDSLKNPGTQFFVGHDDQLWGLSATLGLNWNTATFPVLPTLPGSMLRFDYDEATGMVEANYHYTLVGNRGTQTGVLEVTPAVFAATGSNKISFAQLVGVANAGIDQTCIMN